MSTPESLSKDAIRAVLEHAKATGSRPIEWAMPTPGPGDTHSPDFWIVAAGRLVLVEAKADPSEGGRPPRPGQAAFLDAWSTAGAVCFVVGDETSFANFASWLASYLGLPAPCTKPWRSKVVKTRPKAPPIPRTKRTTPTTPTKD